MNWRRVIDSLQERGLTDAANAQKFLERYGASEVIFNDRHHANMIERLRINSNICVALASALEEGLS